MIKTCFVYTQKSSGMNLFFKTKWRLIVLPACRHPASSVACCVEKESIFDANVSTAGRSAAGWSAQSSALFLWLHVQGAGSYIYLAPLHYILQLAPFASHPCEVSVSWLEPSVFTSHMVLFLVPLTPPSCLHGYTRIANQFTGMLTQPCRAQWLI